MVKVTVAYWVEQLAVLMAASLAAETAELMVGLLGGLTAVE
jgi:hypothetical protein